VAVITVIGEWHQGVVLAAGFAELGHEVRGAVSEPALAQLSAGTPPVHEPGLAELVQAGLAGGRLHYTASFEDALHGAEFAFLALDTPVGEDDAPLLDSVFAAAHALGRALTGDVVLVVTAQVPVGTCERLAELVRAQSGRRVALAHVPEFLRVGDALRTFRAADRFIIGAADDEVADRVAALYAPLGRPLLRMDVRSAELTKHACNAFLATSISFANEIADLCDATGADIDLVTAGMKLDRRIGPHAFLGAGPGFAGGTLGRDLRALQRLGQEHGRPTRLADATLEVNHARSDLVLAQLARVYPELDGLRVGVLGLTYKPGTSTLRRSPGLHIIGRLAEAGVAVAAFDPLAGAADEGAGPAFSRAVDPYGAADGADAVVLVTPWHGLDDLDLPRLRDRMRRPVFVDLGNVLDPARLAAAGFVYLGVGRGRTAATGGVVDAGGAADGGGDGRQAAAALEQVP
jgi:UDPglucose 6-dehydrogenase